MRMITSLKRCSSWYVFITDFCWRLIRTSISESVTNSCSPRIVRGSRIYRSHSDSDRRHPPSCHGSGICGQCGHIPVGRSRNLNRKLHLVKRRFPSNQRSWRCSCSRTSGTRKPRLSYCRNTSPNQCFRRDPFSPPFAVLGLSVTDVSHSQPGSW